jgi:uncharacterized protein
VSSKLPSREQALKILREAGCSKSVVAHCKAVSKLAVETAEICQKKGLRVDVELVAVVALLHDIGRSKTHTVDHVVAGAEIARNLGLPDAVVAIIERHVGGGITDAEAQAMGWPKSSYMPASLEEKIVSYADKLVETSHTRVPIQDTVNKLRAANLCDAADRVQKIHNEISALVGETP